MVGVTYGVCFIPLSTVTDPRSVSFQHPSHLGCMNFSDASVISDQNSVLVKVYVFKSERSLGVCLVNGNSRQSIIWLLLQLMSLIIHSQSELRVRRSGLS